MDRSRCIALALCALLIPARGAYADEQGEADFSALRKKVAQLRASEPEEVQQRIAKAAANLTDCFPGTPEPEWGSRAGTAVEDVDYLYGNPATSADGSTRCFYVVEPLHRPLNLDEARDFSAALLMPDIQHSIAGKRARAAEKERAQETAATGEYQFQEIRRLVASRTARMRDSNYLTDIAPLVGDLNSLIDCSASTKVELDAYVSSQKSTSWNRTIYNDTYWWEDISLDGGRCIYVTVPIGRGLSIDEARDFLTSLQLDLGLSDHLMKLMDDEKKLLPLKKNQTEIDAATPGISRLTVSTYPNNTVAAVRYPIGTGDGVNSSAVQLGPYVYYTAAHVVIDSSNWVVDGLEVRPSLNLPQGFSSTPALRVDAYFDLGYTGGAKRC